MFKLIGVVVVVCVLYLGYDSIKKWYVGDASPKEAVTEVRKKVGEKLVGDETEPAPKKTADNQAADKNASKQSQGGSLDTNEMIRDMMKK